MASNGIQIVKTIHNENLPRFNIFRFLRKDRKVLSWGIILIFVFIVAFFLGRMAGQREDVNLIRWDRLSIVSKLWASVAFFGANIENAERDWDDVLPVYLRESSQQMTNHEFAMLLQRMFAEVRDGHTEIQLLTTEAKNLCSPDILLGRVDGKTIIKSVGEEAEGLGLGICLGDVVTEIDGIPIYQLIEQKVPCISASTREQLQSKVYREILTGPHNSILSLTLIDKNLKKRVVNLSRNTGLWHAGKPRVYSPVKQKRLPGDIGYIAIDSFQKKVVVHLFQSSLAKLIDCKALIIDLRGNSGGNDLYAYQIASHLTDIPLEGLTEVYRKHERHNINQWVTVNPKLIFPSQKGPMYTKPLVILVDAETASAAEDFVVLFSQSKRAIIVGEKTSGSTGQPIFFNVPHVGVGHICAVQCLRKDGTPIQIVPDFEVSHTISDFRKGEDKCLRIAVGKAQQVIGIKPQNI
jgi:C-terminal processing protease CtpA/Prc